MILLTTSDYFPQIGGLSTFTKNIESVLRNLDLDYEVFHWKNLNDIKKCNTKKYKLIINVHSMFAMIHDHEQDKMINFIHGSEILFTSPNFIKKIYKKILKPKLIKKLQRSYFNLFISNSTLVKLASQGFQVNYSRDLIFHNCIDIKDVPEFNQRKIEKELVFIKMARDVPHKNIKGAILFCEELQKKTKLKIKLILPNNANHTSKTIEVEKLKNSSDDERDIGYKNAHYNLLLSLDQSENGFYEGFGLTVLESAKYSVPSIVLRSGGLPEAVHHEYTGYVVDSFNEINCNFFDKLTSNNCYQEIAKNAYEHTLNSHSLNQYELFFKKVMESI